LKFSFITLFLFGLIIGWLGFGERGFIHLYRMEKQKQAYMEKIRKLQGENRKLLDEINRLRHDEEYMISLARRELGLIKDDEVFYRSFRDKEDDEAP
jgi:cell division protein FtsB